MLPDGARFLSISGNEQERVDALEAQPDGWGGWRERWRVR